MFSSRAREFRSYRERNSVRAGFGRLVWLILLLLVAYLFITHFLVASHRVVSISMEPTLLPNDRVLTSTLSYGATVPFTQRLLPGLGNPRRGDLVVASPPYRMTPGFFRTIADPVVRFFTLQNSGLGGSPDRWEDNEVVKRVLGVPGDTVKVENFTVYIRPRGESQFVSEHQLITASYRTETEPLPAGWTSDLPFSGTMGEMTLGPNQYFLVGDNRSRSIDSRYYGPVPRNDIREKIVLRYFPFSRFGIP